MIEVLVWYMENACFYLFLKEMGRE